MSRELPYFQFEVADYLAGDIMICSLEAQGLFTIIKSIYWQRGCKLNIKQILKRYDKQNLIDELKEEDCIKIDEDGDIIIEFLLSQYQSFKEKREKLSQAGRKGGLKNKEARLKPRLSHPEAYRGEEKREEKRRREKMRVDNKTPLSKIKILDIEDSLKNYFEIALAFQQLFIKNLKEKNAPTKNQEKATFGNYVTPIRLMFESDGITKEQLTQVYKFLDSHEGEFWKPNILSIKKLREKFQKLVAKANTTNGKSSNNTSTEPKINRQTISEIKSNASGWGVETPS